MNAPGGKKIGSKLLIGRNEWCQLPLLNIPAIKGKIDTGAKTSAIHAVNITTKSRMGKKYVDFDVLPLQGNEDLLIQCKAIVIDERNVTSSNGQKEHRYVIGTSLIMNSVKWDVELTLSDRDPLRYRLLLGREALNHRVLIHPGIACNQGNMSKIDLRKLYSKRKKV